MKPYKWILLLLALLVFAAGFYLLMVPEINRQKQKTQSGRTVDAFFQEHPQASAEPTLPCLQDGTAETEPPETEELPYADLLAAMQAYNEEIFSNGQSGLSDPWAYTAEAIRLSDYGLDSEVVGVLTIPAMELQEPVYLGATKAHLNSGVAQLSISSMPIGGVDTNCVIAGHRGWDGAMFFRHIEVLQVGDEVILTNLWQTLTYRVSEIEIIKPYQAEKILIQPGRDLLTLITCHPYGSGGRYRYVVYCERTEP